MSGSRRRKSSASRGRQRRESDRAPHRASDLRGDRGRKPLPRHAGSYIWLYGNHAVAAALENPLRTIHRLVHTGDPIEASPCTPVQSERIDREEMEALLPPGAVHQGHAALVAPLPIVAIEDLIAEAGTSANALIVVLDQVNDPQNIGAILRSAAVFGALGVIVQDRHAPEVTGSMAKAASGAVERVPLVRVTNIVRSLETLKDAGFWTTGLDSETDISIEQTPANNRNILILGAEGPGLRRLTRDACDLLVRIGERQTGERLLNSLNVSNAAAVALYALSSRQPKT